MAGGGAVLQRNSRRLSGELNTEAGSVVPARRKESPDMLSRRSLLATIAAIGFVVPALAAAPVDYSSAAFDAALKSGKQVLVWIHAS